MRILRLRIWNFKPFRRLDLPENGDLPKGLILIRGRNSTGKSSLFEAILWAIWGSSAVGLSNEALVNSDATHCHVILEFEVGGHRFKIDRSYDKAKKLEVVLYQHDGEQWVRIADKSGTVRRKIEEILQLDLDQALNTLLVRQGEVAKIALATPSELRDLLVRVYNIDVLNDMTRQLNSFEDDLQARIEGLRQDYVNPEVLEEELERQRERGAKLSVELEKKQRELETRRQALAVLPDTRLVSQLERTQREVELAERDLERAVEDLSHYLEQAGLPIDSPEAISARHRVLESQIRRVEEQIDKLTQELAGIDREMGMIEGRRKDLTAKIKLLGTVTSDSDGVVRCPTCSKPLTSEERERIIEEYNAEIERGKQRLGELRESRESTRKEINRQQKRRREFEEALRAVTDAVRHSDKISRLRKQLEERVQKRDTILKDLGVADIKSLLAAAGVDSLSELRSQVQVLESQVKALEERCTDLEREIEENAQRIEEIEKRIVMMRQIGAEIDELSNLHAHARYVRLNLVKGFIADWVFQQRLIGIVRTATSQYVREFTAGQYTKIDLVSTPPRGRSGPGLELQVQDERDNLVKKKDQLSFGDRTAISLALRLGISRTMSIVRPLKDSPVTVPQVRCVLLDEPLSGLDEVRRHSVVERLVNDKSFEQILLITHTDVQSWQGIPVIDVEKAESGSVAVLYLPEEE